MMKRLHRRVIAAGLPPYFIDANQLHPHRNLSIFPIKFQPIILCRKWATFAFFHILARHNCLTVSFTSGIPRWKTGRLAFSIGTPPECVSENPRSDCFWDGRQLLAKGLREIALMTAVDPFNQRFAWAAKGFRSSTGHSCLKLNTTVIENNPVLPIVSRKIFNTKLVFSRADNPKYLFFPNDSIVFCQVDIKFSVY